MVDRLKQLTFQVSATAPPPHPLDPLSTLEIDTTVALIREKYSPVNFNAVSLYEPRKAEMLAWLQNPEKAPRPARCAEVVCIAPQGKVYDGIVDLNKKEVLDWKHTPGVQPIITMEELQEVEYIVRKDPKVIEQCGILGIPPNEMEKVYCDPWTIGYDERFGSNVRLQQALMYYRPHVDDSQYGYPLDFCPIYNAETKSIIHIDIPKIRRPLSKAAPNNYHVKSVEESGGYRTDIKPINITQPEGVSFNVNGRVIDWQKWNIHVGFNYREGIVLNNITFNDKGTIRPIMYRLSLAEMVVPYGNPEHPHQRKHAFDLGEYGGGYMTNSLSLGCDCKGAIHYMDAAFVNRAGASTVIKNAICIHEEDAGICSSIPISVTIPPSSLAAASLSSRTSSLPPTTNGTIQLDIKLTGILNTFSINPGEDTHGWGTEVYPGVNAHNHQHLFCLRVDPQIDGQANTVFQVDAVQGPGEVGSAENKYGNAFYAKKTKFTTPKEAMSDYNGATSRTWEIANTNKLNPYSKKPVSYKLVSREVPPLLPKAGGLVWKRAGTKSI
uniref:Amine oxidase n=1 Tax=Talaromyces marneffei PM1 TaxID=1077442 RepID=A0A093V6W7_TALMA